MQGLHCLLPEGSWICSSLEGVRRQMGLYGFQRPLSLEESEADLAGNLLEGNSSTKPTVARRVRDERRTCKFI